MPNLAIYQQSDFPAALKWQTITFMKVEWPSIFTGDFMFLAEPYPPELHPIHFVVAEGESLISKASIAWPPLAFLLLGSCPVGC